MTRHDTDSTKTVTEDGAQPRANRGRSGFADQLQDRELNAALAEFTTAYAARGAQEARMIRALAAAYGVAHARAKAVMSDPGSNARGNEDTIFAWHFKSVLGEFAVATHDSDRSLTNRSHEANFLVTRFPSWVTALEQGRIDMRHIRAMLKHLRALPEEHLAAYAEKVLAYASTHSPGQTEARAERLAATIAAEAFEEAHVQARANRHVTITPDGLGMATLNAYLPLELAMPIEQLLEKGARELRALDTQAAKDHSTAVRAARVNGVEAPTTFKPDTRTTRQMRADLLVETLLCATPRGSRVHAVVNLTLPALSLLDDRADGSQPALVDGMLPMSFDEARQFASQAPSLQRVLTHPVTGQVTCVDRYEPTPALRRFLQVRDRTCRHPGCIRPAAMCELDHTTPYREGGPTNTRNLASLCIGHHVQKHEKPWIVTNLGDGTLEWRTPLGQVVTNEPEPVGVRFVPSVREAESDRGSAPQFGQFENSATVPSGAIPPF